MAHFLCVWGGEGGGGLVGRPGIGMRYAMILHFRNNFFQGIIRRYTAK